MQFSNVKAVAAAVMLVLSVVAVGGAAALTVDTETTDTTTTSDLTASSVITEPRNGSVVQNIEIEGDSNTNNSALADPGTAMDLEVIVNDSSSDQDGEVLYNSSANWTTTSFTGATDHYNRTVANDAWGSALEYGADNVTLDFRVTFNRSETDESVLNITTTVDPSGEAAYVLFGADERDLETQSGTLATAQSYLPGFLGGGNASEAAKVSDSVAVSENTSTLTLSVSNQSTQDAFAEVGSGPAGSLSTIGIAKVNGQLVPMFSQSADAEWLNDTAPYATVSEDGSQIVVENANQTWDAGTSSVDVVAVGNDAVGFGQMGSVLSNYDVGAIDSAMIRINAVDLNGDPFEV